MTRPLTHEELLLIQAYRGVRRHQRRAIYNLAIASKVARDNEKAVSRVAKALLDEVKKESSHG